MFRFFLILLFSMVIGIDQNQSHRAMTNSIRDLIFSDETIFKLDLSFSIPISFGLQSTFNLDWSLQFKFLNSSIVDSLFDDSRIFYESFEFGLNDSSYSLIDDLDSRSNSKRRTKRNVSMPLLKNRNSSIRADVDLRRYQKHFAKMTTSHRLEIFSIIEQTLDGYGFNGQQCICRAICELAEMDLLIESPIHFIIQHLLRIKTSDFFEEIVPEVYSKAERFGSKHSGRKNSELHYTLCAKRYAQCPFTIFDRFSI
ncbi:hypothetical protein SSS_08100 [Sarcoptes scabiei]|nr:hypothetical protein SSS_08100 [Sarcoptes scabiei]